MKQWIGFQKGVNIGGWFSQCKYDYEHFETFIGEEDAKRIASWGLDHVRIPVDYNVFEQEDGSVNERGIALYTKAVQMFLDHGLNVIIDLHKAPGFSFDTPEENVLFGNNALETRFVELWKKIATLYVGFGDKVAFELLNEIVEENSDRWNALLKETIVAIREIAPTTKIVTGGIQWNSAFTLKYLEKPQDENIVFNFHFYEPFLFTHQKAGWVGPMPKDKGMEYPADLESYRQRNREVGMYGSGLYAEGLTEMGPSFMEKIIRNAVDAADAVDTYLYCGEYGVIDHADAKSALNWYKDVNSVFVKYGIGRAAWTYKRMDFGLTDAYLESVADEIVKYL